MTRTGTVSSFMSDTMTRDLGSPLNEPMLAALAHLLLAALLDHPERAKLTRWHFTHGGKTTLPSGTGWRLRIAQTKILGRTCGAQPETIFREINLYPRFGQVTASCIGKRGSRAGSSP